MPKPSQPMPPNESGEVFKTELLVQLLHVRVIRGVDSTDPSNHGTIIPAQLMASLRRHGPGLSCMQHGATNV